MKTLKTILQEVISGIKAWVDTNTVHKTGNETINGVKTFPDGIVANVSVDSIAWETITDKPSSFTPVAHTHTKSDVTDLFNSANTWSADQTIAASKFLRVYGYRFQIKNDSMVLGTIPSSNQWTGMQFVDKNNTVISEIIQSFQSSGNSLYQINVFPNEANSVKRSIIAWTYNSANNVNALSTQSDLLPSSNNTYNLGAGNQKWKTLNGINPGALSLPDYANDVSIDTTSWNKTGSMIVYTPLISGWLQLTIPGDVGNFLAILDSGSSPLSGQEFDGNGSARLYLTYPVIANRTYWIYIKASSIITARIVPCLGNV